MCASGETQRLRSVVTMCLLSPQKHPESHIVGALRAVVLLRSGKVAEALAAAGEVASHTPTDEHVLKTLGVVWKATGRTAVRCHVRVTTATCSRSGLPRHCPCFPCLPRCRFSPVW